MQRQAILNGYVRSAANCPERLSLNSDDDVINAIDRQLNTDQNSLNDIKKTLENYNIDQIDLEIQSAEF